MLRGRVSDELVDPFTPTADRLLLAESFARLDVRFQGEFEDWCKRHGVVDRLGFNGGFTDILAMEPPEAIGPYDFADARAGIRAEQDNVRWHLEVLARLSDRRSDMSWGPALARSSSAVRTARSSWADPTRVSSA